MADLSTVDGRSLNANIAGIFDKGVAGFEKIEQEKAQKEKLARVKEFGEIIADDETTNKEKQAALIRLNTLDPTVGEAIRATLKSGDERAIKRAAFEAERGLKDALAMNKGKTTTEKKRILLDILETKAAKGESIQQGLDMHDLPDDEFETRIERMIIAGTDIKTLTAPPELIKGEAGDSFVNKATGKIVTTIPSASGSGIDVSKLDAAKFTGASMDKATSPGGKFEDLELRPEVLAKLKAEGSVKIGGNFITLEKNKEGKVVPTVNQTVIKNGKTEIQKLPLGGPLADRQFGETSQQRQQREVTTAKQKQQGIKDIDLVMEPKIKGAIVSLEQRMKASEKAFERLPALNRDIDLYDRAIDAVKRGAGTGPVEDMMPTFRAATFELQNIQQRLGLNLLSTVTMGALSEKEMDILLKTSIPTGMDGEPLIGWLEDRKAATVKMRNFTEEAIQYFADPEHTLAGFVAKKRRDREKAERQNEGQTNQQSSTQAPQSAPPGADPKNLTDDELLKGF